ncbi:response regulator receiver protein [Methanosarcina mazei]|uniref:Response regulator receiver protein n=1 Tax=Methanosarcina mazei TaxID=2209 RepID=A0A0F8L2A4_METMZ|nr:methanogen output domain 1-containing protein [Methanosarcina mazei]KKG86868.1 response regulator receiver protein [Methanosarcina mazei]KKG94303.1 response regulator receiver protein [Methanosarcina mazei]KKH04864.1 response regulator receiver protein [Methanosarcina mazei]
MKQKEEALLNENNRPKVLIVDDMRENVELMEAYLAVEPYKVFCAYGGKEALRIVDKEKPDIVLLDVMMPEVNGYEVCKILKENPETQFIPVLMLTALSELEDRIKGIEVGADDFLTKPINRLELKTRVKSLLRVKYLHDRLVADRDSLEVKNRVQSILTAVIPTLLQSVSNEEKKVIINQMTGMVEKTLLEMYHFENREMDLAYAGNVCAEIMNQLGGSFYSTMGENDKIWIVKGTRCPWKGEDARKNPILCTLTRKIFSNITLKVDSGCRLEALKTIGNRNDCCEFLIKAA